MTDFHCPTCGTELMEHEAGRCLDNWVMKETGQSHPATWSMYSESIVTAYRLMEWVWERDPNAAIYKDHIEIDPAPNDPDADVVWMSTGPTFPLRVCRAALWLALQQSNPA